MAKVQQFSAAEQAAMQAQKARSANLNARALVLAQAYPMLQSIYSQTISPETGAVINIAPQNVGLIRGFLIRMTATVNNPASGSSTLTPTALGASNLLQQVVFTDLQNYQRINTTGWHLFGVNSAKQGRPFLSSTASDSPVSYGSNYAVSTMTSSIAANTAGTVDIYYYVPIAYTATDLNGAIYANVVNATMNLQLTIAKGAQAAVANTADPTMAMYQGSGAAAGVTVTGVTVNVYQDYFDQLPQGQQGPILPALDLNTIYELKNTTFSGLTVNQDFPMGYSNFRHFLSTFAVFDNQTGGAYPTAGSDVNYWSFRTANYTDTRKADPFTWSGLARRKFLADPPHGVYYFDHRDRPIYTTQQGNVNLVLNASTVNTNAQVMIGYEDMATISNLVNAGSLAGG